MRYLLSVTLMSFSILATGCTDNSSTVPIGTFDAVVEGTISSSSGSALENASVNILSFNQPCENSDSDGYSHGYKRTNAEGVFSKQLQQPAQQTIRCLELNISPPANSTLIDTTVLVSTELELQPRAPFPQADIVISYN